MSRFKIKKSPFPVNRAGFAISWPPQPVPHGRTTGMIVTRIGSIQYSTGPSYTLCNFDDAIEVRGYAPLKALVPRHAERI